MPRIMRDEITNGYTIKIDELEFMQERLLDSIFGKISSMVAERFVQENYGEIAKSIDPVAVANMSIAEAGAKVNETLHKKMPDKILEVQRTVHKTIERGFFGGIKAIY